MSKWDIQVGPGHPLVLDVDAAEDGEAEFTTNLGAAGEVGQVAVLDPGQDVIEGSAHGLVLGGQAGDYSLSLCPLASDAALLGLEQVERDGVGVVGLEGLLLLGVEPSQPLGLGGEVSFVLGRRQLDERSDVRADGLDLITGDTNQPPEVLDVRLDLLHREVGQITGGLVVLATEAEEVGIEDAGTRPVERDTESGAAAPAGHHALEVVGASDGVLTANAPHVEHALHVIEGARRDDRRVAAGVLHAVVGDDADVVRVPQHHVDPTVAQGTLGVTAGGSGQQAPLCQRLGHLPDGPLAGSELVEGPADVSRSGLIDHDGADLSTLDLSRRVAVADGRKADRSADTGLLLHPLLGFCREVGAVELSDRGHDAVEQLAARRLVDVLGG